MQNVPPRGDSKEAEYKCAADAALSEPIASNVQGVEDTEVGELLEEKRQAKCGGDEDEARHLDGKLRKRIMRDLNEMDGDYKSMA